MVTMGFLWSATDVTKSVCNHGQVSSSLDFGVPVNSTGIWTGSGGGSL